MTGFGAAEGDVAGRAARVEIRTVNHRWFNLAARLPGEFAAAEGELREFLRREFGRGHINVSVRWVADPMAATAIDVERVAGVVAALKAMQERFGLGGDVTVDLVARHADLFGSRHFDEGGAAAWSTLEPVVAAAARECRAARVREGAALARELASLLDDLDTTSARIAARAPERLTRERNRMRAHVAALLDGQSVDEGRVAQELAIAADRLDITEELVRFRAHLDASRAALAGDQPVGKQLGFLAQELGREANTMGAKANDAAMAQEVVGLKATLEKFREQLENLE
ncbi:MAG TPA: YicC/YloC family endoribonuclease [Gemmatimonadales bacterium]|nr:YicC/YloC family endoribonuclease [Gemmatimonadales bacterium]